MNDTIAQPYPALDKDPTWGVAPMHTIIGSVEEWIEWCDSGGMSIISKDMTAVICLFDNNEIVIGADGGLTVNGEPCNSSPMCKLTRLNDSCCLAWAGHLNDIVPLFADLVGKRELASETAALNLWLESRNEIATDRGAVCEFLEERMRLLVGATKPLPPEMGVTVLVCSRGPLTATIFQASGGEFFSHDLPITGACQHFMKIPIMKEGSLEQLPQMLHSPGRSKEDSITDAIRFVAQNARRSGIVAQDVSLCSSREGFEIAWRITVND